MTTAIITGIIAFVVWSIFIYWVGFLRGMRLEAGVQREGMRLYSGTTRGQIPS